MPAAALGTRAVAEFAHHPDAAPVGVLAEPAILTWGVFLAGHGYGYGYGYGYGGHTSAAPPRTPPPESSARPGAAAWAGRSSSTTPRRKPPDPSRSDP
ncbi:hypothetical protein [Streptomyces sp. NPDC002287]